MEEPAVSEASVCLQSILLPSSSLRGAPIVAPGGAEGVPGSPRSPQRPCRGSGAGGGSGRARGPARDVPRSFTEFRGKKISKQQNKTSKTTTFYRVLPSEDVKGEYKEVFVCLEGQEGLAALPRCLFSVVVVKIPDWVSLPDLYLPALGQAKNELKF